MAGPVGERMTPADLSYLSQHDLRTHFGLGNYTGPVDVEVRMPGGSVWRWRGQPTDRMLTLTLDDDAAAAGSRP